MQQRGLLAPAEIHYGWDAMFRKKPKDTYFSNIKNQSGSVSICITQDLGDIEGQRFPKVEKG